MSAASGHYVLYGKLGSGAASVHAALEMLALPYRLVETASWEPNAAFERIDEDAFRAPRQQALQARLAHR